jgi:hypothetical protein
MLGLFLWQAGSHSAPDFCVGRSFCRLGEYSDAPLPDINLNTSKSRTGKFACLFLEISGGFYQPSRHHRIQSSLAILSSAIAAWRAWKRFSATAMDLIFSLIHAALQRAI